MALFEFEKPTLSDCTNREWIVTNGKGGFAATTLCGMHTRKYHGLLVASLNPPVDRKMLVSKVEETLWVEGQSFELGTNQYPGTVHPKGYEKIVAFDRMPLPCITFAAGPAVLTKTIAMVQQEQATLVAYQNTGEVPIRLLLRPLLVYKDLHAVFKREDQFNFYQEQHPEGHFSVYPYYGCTPWYYKADAGQFQSDQVWFENIEFREEYARSETYQEDAYSPGYFEVTLPPRAKIHLLFSLNKHLFQKDPAQLLHEEARKVQEIGKPNIRNPFLRDLIVAGRQFVVDRHSTHHKTIIAGYPWFSDWGRDTMIASLGLCIAQGDQRLAQSLVRTFLANMDQGLLPNRFPDHAHDKPAYNAADASLWLFVLLYEYDQTFRDDAFVREVFDALSEILFWYIKGTHFNIHLTKEGLLYAGFRNTQVTWMDAQVGDFVVTPRNGCPVEINVLWYNALEIYAYLGERIGRVGFQYRYLTELLRENFKTYFWNKKKNYLNDLVTPGSIPDDRLRPNQVYCLSLPFALLNPADEKKVLKAIEKNLFTPFGLRTLAPDDPGFKPFYEGDLWNRDNAYHQGTVWPFLLADYYLAYYRIHEFSPQARQYIRENLKVLEKHFYQDGCIHGISEIFDGDTPSVGKGCFHQAWSVAALIRVLIETGIFEED
jgi:predicted glycogen debranching enzyme